MSFKCCKLSTALGLVMMVFLACSPKQTQQEYEVEENFYTAIIDDAMAITKYVGTELEVQIPPVIRELPVTMIRDGAFANRGLLSITIPDNVTSIEYYAFEHNQLTSVAIPNSVTSIKMEAFFNNKLTTVTIPDSLTFIEDGVFWHNQLTSVTIPDSVFSIGNYAFADNQLTSITIPNSVTSIEEGAFYKNQLTNITIPDSVTSIGEKAFVKNQLASITIGGNVWLKKGQGDSWSNRGVFDNEFDRFYLQNGSRAGTYTYNNGRWEYK